jgi:hypothetical protein
MGRAFAGDGFFIDLFCALAAVATGTCIRAGIGDPGYGHRFRKLVCFCSSFFCSN